MIYNKHIPHYNATNKNNTDQTFTQQWTKLLEIIYPWYKFQMTAY